MSELELILKEIGDRYTRENFFRLLRFIQDQIILHGNWKLYEKTFEGAVTNFKMAHNQIFIPTDVIQLSVIGDHNVYFNFDKFTRVDLDITADGPVKIRFLAGSYKERLDPTTSNLPFVAVGATPLAPVPLPQVCQLMDCAAGVAVNDWVYQSSSTNNTAVTETTNTNTLPVIGLVKDKPTSTTCNVLVTGLYSGLALASRGVFRLGTGGTATFTVPATGYIQKLGMSFGNGTIFVKPEYMRLKREF